MVAHEIILLMPWFYDDQRGMSSQWASLTAPYVIAQILAIEEITAHVVTI